MIKMAKLRNGRHDLECFHRMDSYEEYIKVESCIKKAKYETEFDAIHAAIELSRKFGPMRWYRCKYCNHYHLTSQVTVY